MRVFRREGKAVCVWWARSAGERHAELPPPAIPTPNLSLPIPPEPQLPITHLPNLPTHITKPNLKLPTVNRPLPIPPFPQTSSPSLQQRHISGAQRRLIHRSRFIQQPHYRVSPQNCQAEGAAHDQMHDQAEWNAGGDCEEGGY